MRDERDDEEERLADEASDVERTPGSSKMENLRRIDRQVEEQRRRADAAEAEEE